MPRFDLVKFLTYIQTYKITMVHLVPPIVVALAKHPIIDKFDLSSLNHIICGAAPLGSALENLVEKRLNLKIKQGYNTFFSELNSNHGLNTKLLYSFQLDL